MRRSIAAALAAVLMCHLSPVVAMAQAGASIAGMARTSAGRTVRNTTVRLRNLTTNAVTGTTTSNAAGQFRFAGLQPGTYAVEVVSGAGQILGTSAAITLAAGAAITGVAVTAAAAAVTAAAGGLSTGAIVGIVGAGASIATVVAVKLTGSPSQ